MTPPEAAGALEDRAESEVHLVSETNPEPPRRTATDGSNLEVRAPDMETTAAPVVMRFPPEMVPTRKIIGASAVMSAPCVTVVATGRVKTATVLESAPTLRSEDLARTEESDIHARAAEPDPPILRATEGRAEPADDVARVTVEEPVRGPFVPACDDNKNVGESNEMDAVAVMERVLAISETHTARELKLPETAFEVSVEVEIQRAFSAAVEPLLNPREMCDTGDRTDAERVRERAPVVGLFVARTPVNGDKRAGRL